MNFRIGLSFFENNIDPNQLASEVLPHAESIMSFTTGIIGNQMFNSYRLNESIKYSTALLFSIMCTVNSEIFVRTLFSRNFAYAKFRENETLAK